MAKPKKKTSPRIVPIIPPVVAAVAGVAGRAVAKKAVLTAAQRAAKSKATREQAKNRIKKLDKPSVGKVLRKERGRLTSKYTRDAIKTEARTGSRNAMYALKKSGRPTSYSKTTNTVTSPMGVLKKGGRPASYQISQLNKMKNARKPK